MGRAGSFGRCCLFSSAAVALIASSLPLLYRFEGSRIEADGIRVPPSLSGRAVLVTGSTEGIGFAAAVEFCRGGALVLVSGRDWQKTSDAATRVKAVAGAGPGAATGLSLDLADFDDVRRFAADVTARLPRLDVLVLNAGINYLGVDEHQLPVASSGNDLLYATNYLGHFLLVRLLRDHLAAGARIVFQSSNIMWAGDVRALTPAVPNQPPSLWWGRHYGNSKLAGLCFSRALRRRLPIGFRVTTLVPGMAKTNIWKGLHALPGYGRDDFDSSPWGWMAAPEASGRLTMESAFVKPEFAADVLYAYWFPRAIFRRFSAQGDVEWRTDHFFAFMLPALLQRFTYGSLHASIGPDCDVSVQELLWNWSSSAVGMSHEDL